MLTHRDGLHFTELAYSVLFDKFVALIEGDMPDLKPTALAVDIPLWVGFHLRQTQADVCRWYELDPVDPAALVSNGEPSRRDGGVEFDEIH
jgi:hypothetical protein